MTSAGQSPRRTNSMAQLTHDSRSWCRSSSATSCQLLSPGRSLAPLPHGGGEVPLIDDVVAVEHGARAPAAQAHGFAFRDGSAISPPARLGSPLIPVAPADLPR